MMASDAPPLSDLEVLINSYGRRTYDLSGNELVGGTLFNAAHGKHRAKFKQIEVFQIL